MPTFFFGILMIIIFAVGLGWFPAAGGVFSPGLPGNLIDVIRRVITLGQSNPEIDGREVEIFIDGLKHLAMPATVLSLFNLAGYSRYVRSSMLEVLKQDYMRTARAKGVKERVDSSRHDHHALDSGSVHRRDHHRDDFLLAWNGQTFL
jgi:peptide/nickel transport system permease protein